MNELHTLITRRSRELGLPIIQVAAQAGITRSFLYKLMDGSTRDPSVSTVVRLAHALQVPPVAVLRLFMPVTPASAAKGVTSVVRSSTRAGDAVALVPELDHPDHVLVLPGERFTKTWLIQNLGTSFWQGRRLRRMEEELLVAHRRPDRGLEVLAQTVLATQCNEIAVADTPPGMTCEIRLEFTAPEENGSFASIWRLVDSEGVPCFPVGFFLRVVVTVVGS